ncbi:hypothetical protein pb186bvf_019375 [Paramecium bursaria]
MLLDIMVFIKIVQNVGMALINQYTPLFKVLQPQSVNNSIRIIILRS